MPQPDSQGFMELWPTLFLRRELPGAELANKVLREEIEGLEKENPDLTTDYLSGNFLTRDNPAVGWLRDCVNKTVIDYAKRAGIDYELNWSLQAWPNVNRFGDYHDLHNHPHCWLSGTYYIAVPQRGEELPGRKDRRPGAISFYDPRAQANMNAIAKDPQVEAEYSLLPAPGTILLWPAFLHHFVHPNLSKELRISVSFNVVLKNPTEHLPKQ
ncbi:MAG: TIGR02466 family protein [Limibacillus sp.]